MLLIIIIHYINYLPGTFRMIRTRIIEVSVSDQHASKDCMTGKGKLEQYPSIP